MQSLTLSDIKLGVGDLLTRRHDAVRLTQCGTIYLPLLRASHDAIEALPPVVTGKPLVAQLADTDTTHDGYGTAIWHLTEAYQRAPRVSKETREAALRIRQQFVPSLQALNASYADEAQAAIERRKLLKAWRNDLKRIPVEGGTLYDWVEGQIEAGEKLDELLRSRAGSNAGSRKQAASLRGKVVGQLTRFREALRDEREANAKLPADIEARIFGYLDELAAMRDAQGAASDADAEPAAEPKPAPAPTPSHPPTPA